MKPIKWYVYTVAIGLLPMLMRFVAYSVTTVGIQPLSVSDVICFGLVLHVSMISQAEDVEGVNPLWHTVNHGVSVTAVAIYSVLYAISVIGEKVNAIDQKLMLYGSLILAATSLIIGSVVLHALYGNSIRRMQ